MAKYSGGEYSLSNFDDSILHFIINPDDNLPFSDDVNDTDIEEDKKTKIQQALRHVLPEGVSKLNIVNKLAELKEHITTLKNIGKMCFVI